MPLRTPQLTPIPALRDNYIWALHDDRHAVLVDPAEAAPALDWLERNGLTLLAILVTHHHGDHHEGIPGLLALRPVPVYGPARESIPSVTFPVDEGSRVELPELGLTLDVIATPGHTLGHVCYLGPGFAFTGDTLFACGCGRLFEGTAEQMHHSLSRLAALPDDTRVCCAHEYTLANIAFALEADEDNADLAVYFDTARQARKEGRPTLPTTLAQERRVNPFLRDDQPALRATAEAQAGQSLASPGQVFAALREWKNRF